MKNLFFIALFMALTACAMNTTTAINRQSMPEAIRKGQIPLYDCGFYICATITVCATPDDCQTVPKMVVDTGSAGIRLNEGALTEKVRNDFNKKFEDLGHVYTKSTFENFSIKSKYSKAYRIKVGDIEAKNQLKYIDIVQLTFLQKLDKMLICDNCNGIFGISNIWSYNIDTITQMDKVTHIKKIVFDIGKKKVKQPVAILQSPFAFRSYTINFTKGAVLELYIHTKRAPGQIQKKVYNSLVDTGTPWYNMTALTYLSENEKPSKIIGLKSLKEKKVYFYLNGTRIGDTIYYYTPQKKDKK
jgi:hypothetical protein